MTIEICKLCGAEVEGFKTLFHNNGKTIKTIENLEFSCPMCHTKWTKKVKINK